MEGLIGTVLERASRRARAESVRASELLATLAGKQLAIRVLGTPWAERPLSIVSDGIALSAVGSGSVGAKPGAEAVLIGAPISLLALIGSDPQAPIRRGDVRIEGDAQVAEHYRELAPLLLPDLEDSLAQLVGRSAAHLITRGARSAAGLARDTAQNSVRNLAEYLAHESGDLVSRHEAEHFLRGVDELREQFDRLDARLSDIERRAQALGDAAAGQS